MSDTDAKLLDLHELARKRKIRIYYDHLLPDDESFITLRNGETCIFLDVGLSGFSEVKHLTHEIGHDIVGISDNTTSGWLEQSQEKHARIWAATYLITPDDFMKVLNDGFIRCEYEAAEELHVDMETFCQIVEYFKSKGLPVRQCEVISDWRQWDY